MAARSQDIHIKRFSIVPEWQNCPRKPSKNLGPQPGNPIFNSYNRSNNPYLTEDPALSQLVPASRGGGVGGSVG